MLLQPLTNGKVTGTGTVKMYGMGLGGVLVSTDGTNAAVVLIYDSADATGDKLFDLSSKTPGAFLVPVQVTSGSIYYNISGTGASAQLYGLLD